MSADVALTAMPCLDRTLGRVDKVVEAGLTLAQMIAQALPDVPAALYARLRVTIDDHVILPGLYGKVRPKAGARVLIRAVPGNDVLRNILTITLAVAAVAAGQFYGPLLAGSLLGLPGAATGTLSSLLAGGITASTLVAGTLLINALVPPRKDDKTSTPSYAVQGLRNRATPDGVVPLILGEVRIAPVYAALPYTNSRGDSRFVTAAFLVGYGPLTMSDWRIGETPISKFTDVTLNTREGLPGDASLELYTSQVIEEALSIELKYSDPPPSRFTAADVAEISVDISFPNGLVGYDDEGKTLLTAVLISIQYRLNGAGPWLLAPGTTHRFQARSPKPIFKTVRWAPTPGRGRYEVRLIRGTIDLDDGDRTGIRQRTGRSYWAALRGYKPEYIIDYDVPLALAEIEIKATKQLNGTVDELNCLAALRCPDYNVATDTWIVRKTSNPASLFRFILTGPAVTYPLALDEVGALEDWHNFCRVKHLTYNRMHDTEASIWDVLADICAAGRASPHDSGTTWGVVIDRAMTTISHHISPRNSWGFSGSRPYVEPPDAFTVSFLDRTNNYKPSERIVPFPGFEGEPIILEKLDMPGVTEPDMIWKETRRRQYELELRRDTYSVQQDFEHLAAQRGDRVMLSHDVLDGVQLAARVKATGASPDTIGLDDSVSPVSGVSYGVRFRRADGSSGLRTIASFSEDGHTLNLSGSGGLPDEGDLAMIGRLGQETFACTVKSIEAGENLTARLELVDHAPEIEALVDAEVPPPWSGRAGGEIGPSTNAPPVPVITDVLSGLSVQEEATPSDPYPVIVMLDPGVGGGATDSYEVQYRLQGDTTWLGPVTTSSAIASAKISGYTRGDTLEIRPRAISPTTLAGPYATTVDHQVAASDPPPPEVPVYTSATQSSPQQVDHVFRAPDDPSVRRLTILRALGYAAPLSEASILATIVSGQNQSGAYSGSVDIGLQRFWMQALNGSGVASGPAGPREVLVPRQRDSLLSAPDDMTDAAWAKTNLTATLSGSGPDSVTMSMLKETTANGGHGTAQTITFPSGTTSQRIRYAQGIKASGRTQGAVSLLDAAGTSSAQAAFDLSAGTIDAPILTGAAITSATADITQVSVDTYIVILTATIASSGASLHLDIADDTGALSYPGDTAKGLYAWAASAAALA